MNRRDFIKTMLAGIAVAVFAPFVKGPAKGVDYARPGADRSQWIVVMHPSTYKKIRAMGKTHEFSSGDQLMAIHRDLYPMFEAKGWTEVGEVTPIGNVLYMLGRRPA